VGFFRQFTAGDLSQRALGLQQAREVVSGAALTGLLSALFGLVNLSVLFAIDARLALLAIGLTAVIAGVSAGVSFGQLRYERRREAAKGRTEGFLLQLLVGVGKLRAAGAEKRALAQWALRSAEHRKAFLGVQRFTALQTIIQSALPNAALLLVFLAVAMLAKADLHQAALNALVASGGGAGDAAAKTLSIGSFAAFTAAFGQLTAAITSAALASTELLGVAPLLERTRPNLETGPEVSPERVDPGRLAGRIDFRRVTFRYTPSGPALIEKLRPSSTAGPLGV
jgi:ABC-type bacteriocin/lantibiotic exporter with double-glycine peptidase domain